MSTIHTKIARPISETDEIRYKEAFLLLDEDSDGKISVDDVKFLIRALGFTATEVDLDRIVTDLIDDHQVDYLWFLEIMSKVSCTKYTTGEIQKAFLTFDVNHHGLINMEMFKNAMLTLGEPLSEIEMKEMIKDLPIDEDNFIEYENFWTQFK
ncbi:unnamed protein product [Didymodactylos carnosus]|uniref:EF-hand domain-containing protein n=1 Tax=Didymodactylos carnosus TaxID=1234261 RepID=A0A8S2GEP0_9BILA|nr:unnamed protein product [Didymodactylos carnosus]CAF3504345.1 unnamed protein product [Didymodactylos carnosus]